jgi:hypothetical protein
MFSNTLQRRSGSNRAGYTLLEMMTTLPAVGLIVSGIATSVIIMFQAKRTDDNQFRNTYNAAVIAQHITTDLETATSIISSSASHCDFYVPDRNGDGYPERMRYQWTGAAGSPANTLQQIYQNNSAQNLLSNVTTFNLTYQSAGWDATTTDPTNPMQMVLHRHDACEGGTFNRFQLGNNRWCAQYFLPTLPVGALTWELGGIRFMAKYTDTSLDGNITIQIRTATALTNVPTSTILAEVTIPEKILGPNYRWIDVPITPIKGNLPTSGLCIVILDRTASQNVADVMYQQNGSNMAANANWFSSTNSGSTWTSANTTEDMRFYAYGRYNSTSGTRRFMTGVDVSLETNGSSSQRVEDSARIIAAPEVLP